MHFRPKLWIIRCSITTFIVVIASLRIRTLLLEPINGTKFAERQTVSLLKTKYITYRTSLCKLISDWLNGKVGSGAPSSEREKRLLREVNEIENSVDELGEQDDEDQINEVYDKLVELKVLTHIKTATSHRGWLQKTYEFFIKAGLDISDRVGELIRIHDLSKYTHHEVLGYAVKFGGAKLHADDTDDAEAEWQVALKHHLSVNPHHPEYFFPASTDGKALDKTKGLLELDVDNADDYLTESLIDMLACRGERQLAGDAEFSLTKWLDMELKYMDRYSPKDREHVIKLVNKWKGAVASLSDTTLEIVQGHFDNRKIVK